MAKPLQRLAISFMLCMLSLATLSAILIHHFPRSITGLLLTLPGPVLVVCFSYAFVSALTRVFPLAANPIARFIVPILGTVVLLACLFWLAGLLKKATSARHVICRQPSKPEPVAPRSPIARK
jgi:hypothetical protein